MPFLSSPLADELGAAAKVAFLSCPEAHTPRPERVEVRETHLSWVFLTDTRALKMKKPTRADGVDLTTLEARRRNAQEELRLNRRLAADVYLGLVPLVARPDGSLSLWGAGEVVDWLVEMKRLPGERMMDRAIAAGKLTEAEVRRVGDRLAGFYRRQAPEILPVEVYVGRLAAMVRRSAEVLRARDLGLDAAAVRQLHARQLSLLEAHRPTLARRAGGGRLVEGHGDLRPEHVCLLPEPVFIDCLEFDRELRVLDPVDELAFLSMECARLGAAWVEPVLFAAWRELTGDDAPAELTNLYASIRAGIRARLAVLHIHDRAGGGEGPWLDRARVHLRLAERNAEEASP